MDQLTVQHILENRKGLLEDLHRRQAVLRDYVRGVAKQYSTGLYLYGPPGTAKTHTVQSTLDHEIKEIYAYKRGHITPVGLFELIAEHRDEVIVLDDLSSIFKSDTALQILLAALEHPQASDFSRRVGYKRQGCEMSVRFRGGIICISNLELHDAELLMAFKSRVNTLNYAPSNAQLGALMLDIASRGWPSHAKTPTIRPDEARQITEFVIGELLRLDCRFDLRLLVTKAFPNYQQWKDGEAETDWHDLVTASIEEHLVELRPPEGLATSREDRKEQEHALIREILTVHGTREAQVQAWSQRTGKSERAFYRRRAEIDKR